MARNVHDRPEQLPGELLGVADEWSEQAPPRSTVGAVQGGRRRRHRPLEHDRTPAVERVRDRRVRWTISTPRATRSTDRKNGDASVSGRIVEQMSWRNPGSVSSMVLVPPPASSAAS